MCFEARFYDVTLCFKPCLMQQIILMQYKSVKCDVSFSQRYIILVRWTCFSCMCKIFLPAYSSAKIIFKNKRVFTELWSQMYCHLFCESQCITCTKSTIIGDELQLMTAVICAVISDLLSLWPFHCCWPGISGCCTSPSEHITSYICSDSLTHSSLMLTSCYFQDFKMLLVTGVLL